MSVLTDYLPLILALALCFTFSTLTVAMRIGALDKWVREKSVLQEAWTVQSNTEVLALVVTPLSAHISGTAALLLFAEGLPVGMVRNGIALVAFGLFCGGTLVAAVGTAGRMMPALWIYPSWLRGHRQLDQDCLDGMLTDEQYLSERSKLGTPRGRKFAA